jgi:xanthosine utilization system XapX-like protein
MSEILRKIITISLYALMGASIVLMLVFYFGSDVPGTENTPMREPVVTETILIWAYILIGLAMLSAIIFPLIRIVTNPKNAKKTLIGIVGIAVIVLVAWQFSSDEVLPLATENPDNVPHVLKLAGTQLGTMYILLVLAVLSIFYTEIRSLFK